MPILDPPRPVLERLIEGKEPGNQLLTGLKGGADHRDGARREELGSGRHRPRTAQPHLAHAPIPQGDLAGRGRHAVTCAPRNPRARLHRDDTRLPPSRRAAPRIRCGSRPTPSCADRLVERRGPRARSAGRGIRWGITLEHDEALVRNLLSPGLFRRDDRI